MFVKVAFLALVAALAAGCEARLETTVATAGVPAETTVCDNPQCETLVALFDMDASKCVEASGPDFRWAKGNLESCGGASFFNVYRSVVGRCARP